MQKSAEQGLAVAQSWLGTHYVRAEQYKESLYWFTKAAEQGYADAQYRLGLQYFLGYGVKRDKKKARYWMQKAAAQGYEGAIEWLRTID